MRSFSAEPPAQKKKKKKKSKEEERSGLAEQWGLLLLG
jgi:hypothetical protein